MDELDLALLHTLQMAPRITWAQAADVLATTPSTLATRWERLHTQGLAWVTAHPVRRLRNAAVGFIDLDVVPAERGSVIRRLCQEPRAVTVEEAASGRDLVVTGMAPDQAALTRFVLDDLPSVPGVRRVAMRLATRLHREGSDWRLDALNRDQRAALHALTPAPRDSGIAEITVPSHYWPLIEALAHDGRSSAAALAGATGRNPATVRRQLARLVGSGVLSFRCELAQRLSRWSIVCVWHARVPAARLDATVRSLATLPELRLCASTAGESNLMFEFWLRSPADIVRVECLLDENLPWLTLTESALMLRSPKRLGWLLDAEGRSTGEVVVPSPARADSHRPGERRLRGLGCRPRPDGAGLPPESGPGPD